MSGSNLLSKQGLIKTINDLCASNNVDPSELLTFIVKANASEISSNAPTNALNSIVDKFSSLVDSVNESNRNAMYERLNVTPSQMEFNEIARAAESSVNLNECPSQVFAKQPIQIRRELVSVNDKLVFREKRDSMLSILSVHNPRLRQDKFNRLTKLENKNADTIQNMMVKGKFSSLNLPPALNFLLHHVEGSLLAVARTQALIVESMHNEAFDTFKQEILSLQSNLACIRECVDLLEYCRSKSRWSDLSHEKQVKIIVDLARFRPFTEDGFGGGVSKNATVKDMQSTIEKALFSKKSLSTNSSNYTKKRSRQGETESRKKSKKESSKTKSANSQINELVKKMSKEEKKQFISSLESSF